MSRRFNGTSDYLEHGAAVVGAVPITMACWFKSSAVLTGAIRNLMGIEDSSASTKVYLYINTTDGFLIAATVDTAPIASNAISAAKPTVEVWQHAAGVFASSTDRRVFLNGTKNTNTGSRVLGTLNVSTLGARYSAGVRGGFMNGKIAEAAIWNIALDDAEVYLLSCGYYPDQIRPGSLKAYWPLAGQYAPNEIDLKGRFDATVLGAKPAISDHPPMLPRNRRSRALDVAALSVAVDMVPVSRRSYQQAVHRAATR